MFQILASSLLPWVMDGVPCCSLFHAPSSGLGPFAFRMSFLQPQSSNSAPFLRPCWNAACFAKTPVIPWVEIAPHLTRFLSILSLGALGTFYIVWTISDSQHVGLIFFWSILISCHGPTEWATKKLALSKCFFFLTNSLPLAFSCFWSHFCQMLLVKDEILDSSTCHICQKNLILPHFASTHNSVLHWRPVKYCLKASPLHEDKASPEIPALN